MENRVRFLGDTAVYRPDKPQPSTPAPAPSRSAKTPAQIDAQKKRIADTIAARHARQRDQRKQIEKQQWETYLKRRDDALAGLRQALRESEARYHATRSLDDWHAYKIAADAYNKARRSWLPGGKLFKDTRRAIDKALLPSWRATYRDSLRFLAMDGAVVPPDKRGTLLPRAVRIDSHFRVSEDKPRKLSPNVRDGLDLAAALVSPSKLPASLGVQVIKGGGKERAFALPGVMKVSDTSAPAVIAHELAHVIEFSRPDILRKSAAFLHDRAQGAVPVPLKFLYPQSRYSPLEKHLRTTGPGAAVMPIRASSISGDIFPA